MLHAHKDHDGKDGAVDLGTTNHFVAFSVSAISPCSGKLHQDKQLSDSTTVLVAWTLGRRIEKAHGALGHLPGIVFACEQAAISTGRPKRVHYDFENHPQETAKKRTVYRIYGVRKTLKHSQVYPGKFCIELSSHIRDIYLQSLIALPGRR